MEKESKSKTIIIVILCLVVLGLGGYIVYDKYLTKEDEVPMTPKEQENTEDNLLSKEEALTLGKERYKFVRDGLYLCGHNQVKWDENGVLPEDESHSYFKITNIDDIKSNLTEHAFIDWLNSQTPNVKQYENDYYIDGGGCGGDPTYAYNNEKIDVKEISENNISYSVEEYFYTSDDNGIVQDINKADKVTTTFELIKEDNKWKIKEYTDAFDGYYKK